MAFAACGAGCAGCGQPARRGAAAPRPRAGGGAAGAAAGARCGAAPAVAGGGGVRGGAGEPAVGRLAAPLRRCDGAPPGRRRGAGWRRRRGPVRRRARRGGRAAPATGAAPGRRAGATSLRPPRRRRKLHGGGGGKRLQLRAEVEDLAGSGLDLRRGRARRRLREQLRLLEQRDTSRPALPLSPRSISSRCGSLPLRDGLHLELREPRVVGQELRHVVEHLHARSETRTCARARSCSRR